MNFDDTLAEGAFRRQVRAWLIEHATPRPAGSDRPVALFTSATAGDLPEARCTQAALHDAGLAGISWPVEHGGRGGTIAEELIFQQEAAGYELPFEIFHVGIAMAGPAIIAHGTPEQRQRFLKRILRGDDVWCQLFSEPGAGSDLAGMRSFGELDNEHWVVTGQKVWNSGAHYADWGILPVRTDRDQPKHKGISYFLVDMRSPGIEVRPLRQISGHSHFCEVFLDEVRIPSTQLLGEPNQGWSVTRTTLMHERIPLRGSSASNADPAPLVAFARCVREDGSSPSTDPLVRQRLIDIHIRAEILRFLRYRTLTALSNGAAPGPEGSISKLSLGLLLKQIAELALELQGPNGMLADGHAPAGGAWQQAFLAAPAMRIAGGTDEIQRNIIAERVLGLPKAGD